jgi:hypothetical protein
MGQVYHRQCVTTPQLLIYVQTLNPAEWIDGTSVVLSATVDEVYASENAASLNTVTQLGEKNGGGAMATLEMFHQLHCLVSNLPFFSVSPAAKRVVESAPEVDPRRLLQDQGHRLDHDHWPRKCAARPYRSLHRHPSSSAHVQWRHGACHVSLGP